MRFLQLLTVVLLASQVTAAPARVERLPLTHSELHELEAQAREAHSHSSLTARDLHPLTPVLLAELDDSIPAFIVEREVAANMIDDDPNTRMDTTAQQERDMDVDDRHLQTAEDAEDDDDALIESEFEISQPYGGYGGFGGGFGGYGGFGGFGAKGGIGSKKVPYKKVPYKKVPYKKVPFKKAPPKKKLPPKKKFPPKKKGGFGFGGGFGGYGGGFGGHH